ncbi:MAG: ANTAR domain-containing protein [Lachnospiraceae bacterium]|nr:ANTAR domain-containing protein [Lachnospiraceae bacterium]
MIVAFFKPEEAKSIQNVLVRNGFSVAAVCTAGAQVLAHLDQMESSIIVCGRKLTDMMVPELLDNMPEYARIVLIAQGEPREREQSGKLTYLKMPLKVQDLIREVGALNARMDEERRRRRSVRRPRSPEEEELVQRAKTLLMNRNHWTEPQAHRYLQRVSMDTGTNLPESAGMVLKMMQ